jgi:hypothetical protein
MTPEQRHKCDDKKATVKRTSIYEVAKNKHPERWNGKPEIGNDLKKCTLIPRHINPKTHSLEIKQALKLLTTTTESNLS